MTSGIQACGSSWVSRVRKCSEQKPITRSRPVTATRCDEDGSVSCSLKPSFPAARLRGVTVGRPSRSSRRAMGPKSSGWAVRMTRSAMSGRERYWANAPRHPPVVRLQRVPRLFGTIWYGAEVPPRALVSDHVFRTLLEALLAGRYAPGEKLPAQRALAADLVVTMGSVREG